MQETPVRTLIHEITDFLASNPTPEEIIAYQLPADLVARSDDLLERNGEDELTADEREELFDYLRFSQMMSLLKAKTRLKLKQASSP